MFNSIASLFYFCYIKCPIKFSLQTFNDRKFSSKKFHLIIFSLNLFLFLFSLTFLSFFWEMCRVKKMFHLRWYLYVEQELLNFPKQLRNYHSKWKIFASNFEWIDGDLLGYVQILRRKFFLSWFSIILAHKFTLRLPGIFLIKQKIRFII